jgi:hypothetical protein
VGERACPEAQRDRHPTNDPSDATHVIERISRRVCRAARAYPSIVQSALIRYVVVVLFMLSACAQTHEEDCSADAWCREVAMLDGAPSEDTFTEAWTDGTTILATTVDASDAASRMWRFDGSVWAPDPTVPVAPSHVAGTGATDVWVSSGAQIFHYDGASWSESYSVDATDSIAALWASAPDDAWASTYFAGALHWDGAVWTTWASWVPSDIGGPNRSTITAFGGTARDDVWIAEDLWYPTARALVWHWDGVSLTTAADGFGSWRHTNPRVGIAPIDRGSAWLGVFGRIIEVGASTDDGTMFCTFSGSDICESEDPHMAMAREPGGRVWATRSRGTMMTFDGATWTTSDTGVTARLYAIVSSSTGVVRALGEGGTILRHEPR